MRANRQSNRWRTFWIVAVVGFFGGSLALVFVGDENESSAVASEQTDAKVAANAESSFKSNPDRAEGQAGEAKSGETKSGESHAAEPVIEKNDDGCLADSATLADLRRQKIELEARQNELKSREAELKTREQALNEQIKQLAVAREDIEKIDQSRKAESDAKVAKLVEAVENMNPKAAAQLLGSLDEGLATATMSRLSTGKLAKVLNVMDTSRSTKLSELLAGVVRAKTRTASRDAAVATNERVPATSSRASEPSKGGEKNDGKSHDQASNRSTQDAAPTKSGSR